LHKLHDAEGTTVVDHQHKTLFYGAVTVGERGQVVIPAEARRDLDIRAGEKLLVFAHPGERALTLAKVEDVVRVVEGLREAIQAIERTGPSEEGEE